jgi:hypothetical protein
MKHDIEYLTGATVLFVNSGSVNVIVYLRRK